MMHEAATMAAADDDWRSGAAAILDSYEDATWDEMRQQDESMAAISSASPVKSPDMTGVSTGCSLGGGSGKPAKCKRFSTVRNCQMRGQCNCGGKKIATACDEQGNGNEKN
ncbi:hypothetical protein PC114_g14180 [Phytophthora cactorum]|nr:hypothetical protein PC114_g14180 [Phytophthora cactorum]